MGAYLHKVELGAGLRISDSLDRFLQEHCSNYLEQGSNCVNFEELTEALGLNSKEDLLTSDCVDADFKKLIKGMIGQEDVVFIVDT